MVVEIIKSQLFLRKQKHHLHIRHFLFSSHSSDERYDCRLHGLRFEYAKTDYCVLQHYRQYKKRWLLFDRLIKYRVFICNTRNRPIIKSKVNRFRFRNIPNQTRIHCFKIPRCFNKIHSCKVTFLTKI